MIVLSRDNNNKSGLVLLIRSACKINFATDGSMNKVIEQNLFI